MDSFLPLLKKNALVGGTKASSCKEQDLKFRIDFDEVGAYVSVIDKQGQELEVDYHAYTGDTYQILRCIANILEEQSLHITWDKSDQRIYLHNNPYLLFMLTHCSNLVDNHLQPIGTTEESTHLQLVLNPIDGEIQPLLQLVTEADQRVIGVLSEEQTNAFAFLTDSFVLAGGTLYPVKPVGENFRQLVFFCSRFHQTQIEQYLSVFASYVEGVEIVYADYRTEVVQQGATSEPTLIFEKVDSDNALYLRLEYTLPGMSWDFLQHFDPTWAAHLTSDHRIVLQPIVSQSVSQRSEELRKFITSFSPTRAAAREVYVEHHNFFLIPAETAAPFLLTGLPSLISEYRLLGAEKLKEYKVKPVKPKLLMKMSSGIDFLEGDVTVQIEADTLTLKDMLAQYQKNKYIILSDGNRALLDEDYMKRLQRVFHPDKKKKVTLSFFDLPEVEQLLGYLPDEKVFKRHRDFYEGFNALSGQTFRKPKVKAKLRPYQQEGVKWMKYLYDNNLNGCLADDMGLGKTLQTLTLLASIYPKQTKPALLVMPRSLLFNWESEAAKFAPQLDLYTYYGQTRDINEAMRHQVVLTTYAIVRNDIEMFSKQQFHFVILDESQNIKNVEAQMTQAVQLLQCEHRLALSGTPIENNLTEIYSLFRFLNPGMFGSLDDFNHRYALPIQHDNDAEVLQSLQRKIYPFILRRLKKDVLRDLPDRIDQTLYVEMDTEQSKFYDSRRRYYLEQVNETIKAEGIKKSQFVMFQALNELRRIASVPESLSDGRIVSPKLELLLDSIQETVLNGHKAVVFFNYIAGIELVAERLEQIGIDFTCMTGSTTDRRSVVERFQTNSQCMVLLMTLKTGGTGLNLTAADTVYIFEPWWNKAAEEQAINRLHRIGQKAKVLSYSVITKGTIEEKIQLLQQQKSQLVDSLISNDTSTSKQLTEEDINYILG